MQRRDLRVAGLRVALVTAVGSKPRGSRRATAAKMATLSAAIVTSTASASTTPSTRCTRPPSPSTAATSATASTGGRPIVGRMLPRARAPRREHGEQSLVEAPDPGERPRRHPGLHDEDGLHAGRAVDHALEALDAVADLLHAHMSAPIATQPGQAAPRLVSQSQGAAAGAVCIP